MNDWTDILDRTFHSLSTFSLYVSSRTVLVCAVLAVILSLLLDAVWHRLQQSHAVDYRDADTARRLEKDLLIIGRILSPALILLAMTLLAAVLLSAMN